MQSTFLGLLALLSFQPTPPAPHEPQDEVYEHTHETRSAEFGFGELENRLDSNRPALWPVKVLSIGHSIASYQYYAPTEAYFHHGLDIRADEGTPVIASRGGKVVNIENYVAGNPQYWEVAILDTEGFLWQYHHVDRDSIPTDIEEAYKTGREIADGTKIGEVVYWPIVSFGERYHHVHLNILGKNKEYVNPFLFLEPLADVDSPEIAEIGIYKNGQKVNSGKVSGKYTLYADVRDLVLSKVFTLPPTHVEVTVDGGKPFTVWDFSKLPGGPDKNKFVSQFYIPRLACGNYSCRKPVIDLGFKTSPGQVFPTAPGKHEVLVNIKDDVGNTAQKTFTYTTE